MSNIDRFANTLRMQASNMDSSSAHPRYAIITSVDVAQHSARVTIQPEGIVTGWLPISSASVGAGFGLISPPSEGDQVLVLPQEGDHENWCIVGRVFSTKAQPANVPSASLGGGDLEGGPKTPIQSGEIGLVSKSGAVIRLCADGSIYFRGPVTIDGDLVVNGDVSDRRGSLQRLRQNYNQHKDVDSRGDTAGLNDHQDPE